MSSGAKRNRGLCRAESRYISDFSGRLRFLASLGMTLGLGEIFNAQVLMREFVPLAPELAWGLGFEQAETPWGNIWGKGGNEGAFTSQVSYLPHQGMTTATIFNRDYSLGNLQAAPDHFNLTEALFNDVLGEPPQTS